jgi:hypothetical protein
MNSIWRFYIDDKRQWRWQQLGVTRTVISESEGAYKAYEACVANAAEQGYVFVPARTKPVVPKVRASKSR